MNGHDIIVIGGSAGGVEALKQFVRGLNGNLPAALFVVIHISPHAISQLPAILSNVGGLTATHALDGDPIRIGHIYVAPPDKHLVIESGRVRVTRGPKENNHRPAIDPLFRTAASVYGPRVVGVILSGSLDDGTAGLATIKQAGGIAAVQHPGDAIHPDMPRSALEHVAIDHCLPVRDLSGEIVRLAYEPVTRGMEKADEETREEGELTKFDERALQASGRSIMPSGFACPECGGALFELSERELVRYRCRVGHAWSPQGLLGEQADAVERGLWIALRALEEKKALAVRMAGQATSRGHDLTAGHFNQFARNAETDAEALRQLLLKGFAADESKEERD